MEQQFEQRPVRVKTRFLGFKFPAEPENDEQHWIYEGSGEDSEAEAHLGRLLVVHGPGRGRSFALSDDVSRIGRGNGQEIQLAFGDSSVSRDGHATVIYYGERDGFEIQDGGKANPVLVNGQSLQGNDPLENGDLIRVGETTLRFFAF